MKLSSFFLMAIIMLLTACTQTASPDLAAQKATSVALLTAQASMTPPAQVLTELPAASQVLTATTAATATKAPTPTRFPTATPSPSPKPTDQSRFLALANATEIPALGASGMAGLHNLVLFRSRAFVPFSSHHVSENEAGNTDPLTRFCRDADGFTCLWAVSPDGRFAGLLSPQDFDFNMYLPLSGLPQFAENGLITNHPSIQPVRLPEICRQEPDSSVDQRCDRILFSPDGRYLGFRYGPDICGRSMQLIDRQTGETVLKIEGGVHGFGFLSNGKMALSRGHCEGSGISYFDPRTRQTVVGGGDGLGVWNQSRSILVVANDSYDGKSSSLWGYNTNTGTVFYPEGKDGWLYDEHAIFLPDGRRFLYQHFKIGVDREKSRAVIDTPAQIVRYDPISGQRTVLASDPAYHYRLCQFDYEQPCPTQWYGDWIQVQRVPFTPLQPLGYDWSLATLLPCFEEGQQCAAPPESFALKAHTGEILPWNPASLPLAYPTPTRTPGPDTLGQPVYADPAGQFSLYTGTDGKSLWLLPREGPAIQWVWDGEDFFYLP